MPVLIVPPSAEPVSLSEAKAWLRYDGSDDDDLIRALCVAARMIVEAETRRSLMPQTWRLVLDRWPRGNTIALVVAPLMSIAAVRVHDPSNVAQSLPASSWQIVGSPDDAQLVFATMPVSLGRDHAGIEIDVIAGYASAADVPQPLRQAILMLAARWYEHRGDDAVLSNASLPVAAAALVAPFRRLRLG